MDEESKRKLEVFLAKHPDLFPPSQLEKAFKGLPSDPEFGKLSPRSDDAALTLMVDCPPWGNQKLEVTLYKAEAINPAARSLIRLIRKKWPAIWGQALTAWNEEYPTHTIENLPTPWTWVLEAGIGDFVWSGRAPWGRWLPSLMFWNLSVSANAAASMVDMIFLGTKRVSSELL